MTAAGGAPRTRPVGATGPLLLAAGVAAAAAVLWWWPQPQPPVPAALPAEAPLAAAAALPATAPAAAVAVAAAAPAARAIAPPPSIPRVREADADPTPDIADYVNPGEQPTMAEVIARLHAAGVRSGLGAFSPPGTRPPLVGLAVPEDFVLPEGYVRHHQSTDDGQRIEPILMFAPGHQLLDAAGQPVPLPADRVVPPELAPPGLPLRRIVLPAPLSPGK